MIDGSMQAPEQMSGLENIKLADAFDNAYYVRNDDAVLIQASPDTVPYLVTGLL